MLVVIAFVAGAVVQRANAVTIVPGFGWPKADQYCVDSAFQYTEPSEEECGQRCKLDVTCRCFDFKAGGLPDQNIKSCRLSDTAQLAASAAGYTAYIKPESTVEVVELNGFDFPFLDFACVDPFAQLGANNASFQIVDCAAACLQSAQCACFSFSTEGGAAAPCLLGDKRKIESSSEAYNAYYKSGTYTPAECVAGEWGEWSECTATCGESNQIRTLPAGCDVPGDDPNYLQTKPCRVPECFVTPDWPPTELQGFTGRLLWLEGTVDDTTYPQWDLGLLLLTQDPNQCARTCLSQPLCRVFDWIEAENARDTAPCRLSFSRTVRSSSLNRYLYIRDDTPSGGPEVDFREQFCLRKGGQFYGVLGNDGVLNSACCRGNCNPRCGDPECGEQQTAGLTATHCCSSRIRTSGRNCYDEDPPCQVGEYWYSKRDFCTVIKRGIPDVLRRHCCEDVSAPLRRHCCEDVSAPIINCSPIAEGRSCLTNDPPCQLPEAYSDGLTAVAGFSRPRRGQYCATHVLMVDAPSIEECAAKCEEQLACRCFDYLEGGLPTRGILSCRLSPSTATYDSGAGFVAYVREGGLGQDLCDRVRLGQWHPSGDACCASSCGDLCGASNCADGGSDSCCRGTIRVSRNFCQQADKAPCALTASYWVSRDTDARGVLRGGLTAEAWCVGLLGGIYEPEYGVCCDSKCGSCGGSGCGNRPGGSAACCVGAIRSAGVSCYEDTVSPPCNVPHVPEPQVGSWRFLMVDAAGIAKEDISIPSTQVGTYQTPLLAPHTPDFTFQVLPLDNTTLKVTSVRFTLAKTSSPGTLLPIGANPGDERILVDSAPPFYAFGDYSDGEVVRLRGGGFVAAKEEYVIKATPLTETDAGPVAGPSMELRSVNCVVTEWLEWSDCDASCGEATKTRTREVMVPAENGGIPCPSTSDMEQAVSCGLPPCRTTVSPFGGGGDEVTLDPIAVTTTPARTSTATSTPSMTTDVPGYDVSPSPTPTPSPIPSVPASPSTSLPTTTPPGTPMQTSPAPANMTPPDATILGQYATLCATNFSGLYSPTWNLCCDPSCVDCSNNLCPDGYPTPTQDDSTVYGCCPASIILHAGNCSDTGSAPCIMDVALSLTTSTRARGGGQIDTWVWAVGGTLVVVMVIAGGLLWRARAEKRAIVDHLRRSTYNKVAKADTEGEENMVISSRVVRRSDGGEEGATPTGPRRRSSRAPGLKPGVGAGVLPFLYADPMHTSATPSEPARDFSFESRIRTSREARSAGYDDFLARLPRVRRNTADRRARRSLSDSHIDLELGPQSTERHRSREGGQSEAATQQSSDTGQHYGTRGDRRVSRCSFSANPF
ncbi:unnamed protein product [Vitrella brassicaformis CCMP3155]|uniref:Uncharacterized protein n=1 Tax=Vitrella brassicaformis (strain CCMP3155) TaxID=1169540 RepID=A0A0G4EGB2_VITBC|nr:unnamed protein product [Vitrella brassicaformis CCMP3155]|eukprot:CEL94493.1 unnamed protein product [Vitrella brassicaformis CCMP3155]